MSRRISVLVVDDQIEIVRALVELIEATPSLTLVGSATDVADGLALAVERRPDVALVDYKMPHGGGPKLTADLAVYSPETKVVALSAHDDRPAKQAMLHAGASAFLVKGADIDDIVAAVEAVVL